MSWALFVGLVLPTGGALAAMLASGQSFAMKVAHFVLLSPVRIGKLHLSLGVFMTMLCAVLSALCYSSLRRSEAKLSAGGAPYSMEWEQGMRHVFYSGRNFYICLLGLTLWAFAWRLNSLYVDDRLQSKRKVGVRSGSSCARLVYVAVAFFSLVLADVPLCRLNYNFQLGTFVTPKKDQLIADFEQACTSAMLVTAQADVNGTEPCTSFCLASRELSEDRLWSVQWARRWHPVGRFAAVVFDDLRHVEQGADRIDDLFERKTCLQVLKSVDKSNFMVNCICVFAIAVSLIGFLSGIMNAAITSHGGDEKSHNE